MLGSPSSISSLSSKEEQLMPIVEVRMMTGRTKEQKQRLADAISEAMVDHVGSTKSAVYVIINDVSYDDWYQDGQPYTPKIRVPRVSDSGPEGGQRG
jgi:4-oxalocrotonate tautomerase